MGIRTEAVRVDEARTLAGRLLVGVRERWQHTIGVARQAQGLADTVDPDDRDILISAAWLHDIGYGPSVRDTGFHPLDGARYLQRQGWPDRIVGLVAHHSGAQFLAQAQGHGADLSQYPHEHSAVSDALTYADQTIGPHGRKMRVKDRLADALERHGPDSPQALMRDVRGPYLLHTADRVEARLRG